MGPCGLTRVRTQGRLESRSSSLSPQDALEESSEKAVQNPHHPTLKTTCSFGTDYSKFHRHAREKSEAATLLSPEIAQLQGPEAPAQRVGRKTPKEQEEPQGLRPQVQQVRLQTDPTKFCFHRLSFTPSARCPLRLCTAGQKSHLGTGTTNGV